jgi:glycosyltransferase involved in cell wall biosynthesis
VGIDAHPAEHEGMGNATYFRHFLRALAAVDATTDYVLYAANDRHPFYRELRDAPNVRIRQLVPRRPSARVLFALGALTWLDRVDLLYVQYFAPLFNRGRLVVLIHDNAYHGVPASFSRRERVRSRVLFTWSARRADRVVTDSEFSRADIERLYGLAPGKVAVAYAGVAERFRPPADPAGAAAALARYGVRRPYVLYVGRLNERKQLPVLIRAFARAVAPAPRRDLQLVIAGKSDFLKADLATISREVGAADRVRLIGFVPDDDLPPLYGAAELFVYPSLFEGFGLPVLEAMACGVPVIASPYASLPEVCGDAAMLVEPAVEPLAEAIARVVSDPAVGARLRRQGLARAGDFSWEATARRTLDVFRSVCAEPVAMHSRGGVRRAT